MSATKSVLSTVYFKSQVTATVNGVYPYNPTSDVVEAAFVAPGTNPAAPDWRLGSWETKGTSYFARALVGPGPGAVIDLPAGTYRMWVRVTDNPEIPVLEAGNVRVV
jgi:hypothetical protein